MSNEQLIARMGDDELWTLAFDRQHPLAALARAELRDRGQL